jgi:N-acetylmuramoyl-L-alanine amidase
MVKLFLIIIFLFSATLYSQEYLIAELKSGDGIYSVLRRYEIPPNPENISLFKELNNDALGKNEQIILTNTYLLPIKVYRYNGKSIRSTIGNNDWDNAVKIQKYNEILYEKSVRKADYRDDNILWVPDFKIPNMRLSESKEETLIAETEKLADKVTFEIFGDKYKDIDIIDNSLKDCIYYVVSGHGGPDPGAVGFKNGNELHEDEYAYDVALRLARNLIQHGATVYIIVKDDNDGIRDEYYLNNSKDEYYHGNHEIALNQLERLRKRAEIINDLYRQNESSAKKQRAIVFHVDSRYTGKMIDIFFYHAPGSQTGYDFNTTLLNTIKEKYAIAQPGRGYEGTVTGRGLYMTRNILPVTSFIEIGNIQNARDQKRILQYNNRQAIANWLLDGILKFDK